MRFEQDMTQAEIGAVIGVSQMQVSRVIRQAIARLRAAADAHARRRRRPDARSAPSPGRGVRGDRQPRQGHEEATMADIANTVPGRRTRRSEAERLNRELDQLLGELRVAMPGVQVLFAFLLAVPFQQRFAQVTEFQRDVYFVTLLASAAASALFVAPDRLPPPHVPRARQAPARSRSPPSSPSLGLACLAFAMNGAVLLVTDVLFSRTTAVVTVAATGTLFVGLWFVLGLVRQARQGQERHDMSAPDRDPRRRRHARRLQLPARARRGTARFACTASRSRSGAVTARSGWAATSSCPTSPARASTPSTATRCATPSTCCSRR